MKRLEGQYNFNFKSYCTTNTITICRVSIQPRRINRANRWVPEVPGASVSGDLDGNLHSRIVAVGYALAD